jgi:hypothetical protein
MKQHEDDPIRSRSLVNLHSHPLFQCDDKDDRPGRSIECISLAHLKQPSMQLKTIDDQSPLWTALTITAQISHPSKDS